MIWWLWLLLGLMLMLMEAFTPGGFFVLFFGVGAALVGLAELAGVHMEAPIQGLVFVALSIVCTALFRKPLLQRFHKLTPRTRVDSIAGETAVALEEIAVNAIGKAELRGSSWNAHNVGEAPIARSARCRVERVDGLTLHVRGI